MLDNSENYGALVQQANEGDSRAWQTLLAEFRPRLRKMISLRLTGTLRGRVDPSDVVQEALCDAFRRLPEFTRQNNVTFYLWLRRLASQRLVDCFRAHLGAQSRDQRREVAWNDLVDHPDTTDSIALAELFIDQLKTPSEEAELRETRQQLELALEQLDPIDRQILAMRHFEELSNGEAAELLGLDKSAASKRYARAIQRLAHTLKAHDSR